MRVDHPLSTASASRVLNMRENQMTSVGDVKIKRSEENKRLDSCYHELQMLRATVFVALGKCDKITEIDGLKR